MKMAFQRQIDLKKGFELRLVYKMCSKPTIGEMSDLKFLLKSEKFKTQKINIFRLPSSKTHFATLGGLK